MNLSESLKFDQLFGISHTMEKRMCIATNSPKIFIPAGTVVTIYCIFK
jgi:hypothetical protein